MSEPAPEQGTQIKRVVRVLTASILPSLLAVMAVAAVITALYVWHQDNASTEAVEATSSGIRHSSMTSATPQPSPPPTASTPSGSALPLPAASPTVTPTPPKSSAKPTPRKSSAKPAPQLSVVVLNQTRRTGLARSVAQRLNGRGWTVVQVGNFRGNIPLTTVYYPPGASSQAAQLARTLPVQVRTRPVFGNLPRQRLTVVLTDNYPRGT